jgi:hypothetical protein
MKNLLLGLVLLSGLYLAGSVQADRADHFKGLPADTLEEAVTNFSEYNEKLRAILARDELTAADIGTIHELTYTLENALEKINAEFAALAETLEEVHVASETADYGRVKEKGREYLSTATTVVK